jgi:hypothetical protein
MGCTMSKLVPLDDLETLRDVLSKWKGGDNTTWARVSESGDLHCPICGRRSRMQISLPFGLYASSSGAERLAKHFGGEVFTAESYAEAVAERRMLPCLVQMTCLQCKTVVLGVLFLSPSGPALAILPAVNGGESTPHTPASVAYYLDQAYKSHLMGANSAAVGMYRVAMEHMLYDQGYTKGLLKDQTIALEKDIAAGTGPAWTKSIDTADINDIRELGNYVLHTNAGDITKQASIDANLVRVISAVFAGMLQLIYEEPHVIAQRRAMLAAARGKTVPPTP